MEKYEYFLVSSTNSQLLSYSFVLYYFPLPYLNDTDNLALRRPSADARNGACRDSLSSTLFKVLIVSCLAARHCPALSCTAAWVALFVGLRVSGCQPTPKQCIFVFFALFMQCTLYWLWLDHLFSTTTVTGYATASLTTAPAFSSKKSMSFLFT